VHIRISAPPVKWPCFYGIDFPTRAELIANGLDIDGIRRSIGADTLGYVSLAGLISATEQPKTRLCRACFDGEYPIELPSDNLIGKHVLEGVGRRVDTDDERPEPGQTPASSGTAAGSRRYAGPGGTDALVRP
jgi:amidophosphoribosyltransferase